jgi:hypothetical protein
LGQIWQTVEPAAVENEPNAQFVHADKLAVENVPLLQDRHVAALVAPATLELVPAGQPVHAEAPAEDVYEPAGQLVHVEAPAEDENEPAVQYEHVAALVALVLVEKDPTGHAVQLVAPRSL